MAATDGIGSPANTIAEVLAMRSMARPKPVLISDELQDVLTQPRAPDGAAKDHQTLKLPGAEATSGEHHGAEHQQADPHARPRIDVRA